MTTTRRITVRDADLPISALRAFRVAGIRGEDHVSRYASTGRLGDAFARLFRERDHKYVVYSYATPIAWLDDDGWTMPKVKYSVTTTNHQNVTRAGMRAHGGDIREIEPNDMHVDYPHEPGYLVDCDACHNGPCRCAGHDDREPCVSKHCQNDDN
jgi:hypothetical protein